MMQFICNINTTSTFFKLIPKMISFELVTGLTALVVIFIAYFKWTFQYWKRRNVPFFEPAIPFGNLEPPYNRTKNVGESIQDYYNKAKKNGWKHVGFYSMTTPVYVVTDLEYLKNIMSKDFSHFVDRGFYVNEKDDPMGAHLFSIGGTKWRTLRTKLTPTFTSGKMKMMFPTLAECVELLKQDVARKVQKRESLDIKEMLGCFTTDIIGSCAFGLDCNTIKENDSPFRLYGKKFFAFSTLRAALFSFSYAYPSLSKMLGIRAIPKDISDFFTNIVHETVQFREDNKVIRKDFLQLLIEMKNQEAGENLTMEEVVAQCFIFFLAGFETSSSTMTFALYELAKQQEVQDKLRDEIKSVLDNHGGKMTYEAIMDMKYMNQVIDETLRKYPPLPLITRTCVKQYKVPNTDIILDKGIRVFIPILAIHKDPELYPNPDHFDPERFTEENKRNRHQYAHIPFGEGPRLCLGLRFGVMQTKMGLASLLKDYVFTVNAKTKEPMKMATHSLVSSAEGGIWLDAKKL